MRGGGSVLLAFLRHLPLPLHDALQVLEEVGLWLGQWARAEPRVLAAAGRQGLRLPREEGRRYHFPAVDGLRGHPQGRLLVTRRGQLEGDSLLVAQRRRLAAASDRRVLAQVEGDLLLATVLVGHGARVPVDLLPRSAVPQHRLALEYRVRRQLGHFRGHAGQRLVLGEVLVRQHGLVAGEVVLHLFGAGAARRQLEGDLLRRGRRGRTWRRWGKRSQRERTPAVLPVAQVAGGGWGR